MYGLSTKADANASEDRRQQGSGLDMPESKSADNRVPPQGAPWGEHFVAEPTVYLPRADQSKPKESSTDGVGTTDAAQGLPETAARVVRYGFILDLWR